MSYYLFISIQIHILITLTVFALPINYFTGFKIYQLIIISLCLSVVSKLFKKLQSKTSIKFSLIKSLNLFIFSIFIIVGFISGAFQNGIWKAFLGSVEYIVVFGLFLFLAFLNFPFCRYMNGLIVNLSMAAVVVGLLGVYQYYIDSILFGIYSEGVFSNLDSWSLKRVPSIFGSIQVFAAFMTYVILLLFIFKPFHENLNSFIILLLAVLGSFSGSFLFYGGITLIILGVISHNKKIYLSLLFLFLFLIIYIYSIFYDEKENLFMPIFRLITIFSPDGEFLMSNSERFAIWMNVISQTPLFYGNGFGQASTLVDGPDRFNTESYFFSIYYQTGILGSLLMFILLASLLYSASRGLPMFSKIIFSAIVCTYLLGVHVFYSIMMIPFWLLIVQTKMDSRK